MKMATGVLTARSRGTRWPSVSLAVRSSSLGEKSSRRTKWSMTPRSGASASRRASRGFTLSSSVWPRCFSVATAIAVSQSFDHGSEDSAKNARRPC